MPQALIQFPKEGGRELAQLAQDDPALDCAKLVALDDGGDLQASLAEMWVGGIHDQVRRQGSWRYHRRDEREDHIIARSVTPRDHNRRPNLGSRKVRKREGSQDNCSPSHL